MRIQFHKDQRMETLSKIEGVERLEERRKEEEFLSPVWRKFKDP